MDATATGRRIGSSLADGFSLPELVVVLAITAALAVLTARELASTINLGRQLAIAMRSPVCVDLSGSGLRFRIGGCAGDAWTGSLTDASGMIHVSDPTTIAISSNGRLVFTTLGAASPAATYTVRHARTQALRTVVVAGSGRISVE
jgi:prepilin-type N-terminal cleavage/methylation domain-containing protein